MKRVTATIRSDVRDNVITTLESSPHIQHFSLKAVEYYSDSMKQPQHYRGRSITKRWQPAYELSFIVPAAHLDSILHTLLDSAKLGEEDDGLLIVQAVERVVAIATGAAPHK